MSEPVYDLKHIRIVKNEHMPPDAFLLLSEADEPCPFCHTVPTLHIADATRAVRACKMCGKHWGFTRTVRDKQRTSDD